MPVELYGLVLITGLGCTLRCRDCANHMPYVPPEHRKVKPLQSLRDDIARLAGRVQCTAVQIQGGEPLIHSEIPELIDAIAASRIAERTVIVTSATLPLTDAVLDACAAHNVAIRLSDYGLSQQRLEEYEQQCRDRGVATYRFTMATRDSTWLELGGPGTPRCDDDDEVRSRFATCPFRACWTLFDGHFTRCSRAASTHYAGLNPFIADDFVAVREDPETLETRLRAFVGSDRFLDACRYCFGGHAGKVTAGIQLSPRPAVITLKKAG